MCGDNTQPCPQKARPQHREVAQGCHAAQPEHPHPDPRRRARPHPTRSAAASCFPSPARQECWPEHSYTASDLSGHEHPRDEGRSLRSGNPSASPDPPPHPRRGRGGEPTVSCDGAAYEHPSAPLPRSPGACSLLTLAPGRERAARENPARNPRAPPQPPPLPPGTRRHQREESEWRGRGLKPRLSTP